MGAKNSTPQTARIENPDKYRIPIYVTPSVVSRLESASSNQQQHEQQQNPTINIDNEKSQDNNDDRTKSLEFEQQQKQHEQQHNKQQKQQQKQEEEGKDELYSRNYLDDNGYDAPNTEKIPSNRFKEDWSNIKNLMEQQYSTIDEETYNHTCDKIKKLLGESNMLLRELTNKEIMETRLKLMQCLRDNPNETLLCANVAKEYREAVFREQYRKLDEFNYNNNGEGSRKSCPT